MSDELLLVVEAQFVVASRGLVVLPPIEPSFPVATSRDLVARVDSGIVAVGAAALA